MADVTWLDQATELEGLAKAAQTAAWTDEQAARADALVMELSELMLPPPVIEPPIPPEPIKPPASTDKYPKQPPISAVVRKVPEDYPNVMAALEAAKPGETVSCADGFKVGDLTVTKEFDPTNPVILRSRNIGKAELNQRVRLKGQGLWLHGFKSTYKGATASHGDGAICLDADYLTLTRLEVQSPQGITSMSSSRRRGINIGWCLFSGQNPSGVAVSNIFFSLPGEGSHSKVSDLPRNVHIYRCDFHDNAKRPAGPHEDHCIYFGHSKPRGDDVLAMEDVEIYQCLIRSDNERIRGFYVKRGCRMTQNSLLGRGYNWGIRHGGDAVIEANIATGYKLQMCGAGSRILGNLSKNFLLNAGSGPKPLYQACDRTFLDSNTGPLFIGYVAKTLSQAEGGKCGNVVVCNHSGSININDAGTERSSYRKQDEPQGEYLPRLPLTPSDVGPAG